jgi:hypothetical protein
MDIELYVGIKKENILAHNLKPSNKALLKIAKNVFRIGEIGLTQRM